MRAEPSRLHGDSNRLAFTVLELVIVMAIVGVLVGIVLPAVHSAREAARKLQCSSHLAQIGLALHQYHDSYGGLPPGWLLGSSGDFARGWATAILPFVDEPSLHPEWDRFREPSEPMTVGRQTPSILLCPSDIVAPDFVLFAEGGHEAEIPWSDKALVRLPSANYLGVFGTRDPDAIRGTDGDGAFVQKRSFRFAEFTRGLSNSLLIGERTARRLPSSWLGFHVAGEDARGRIVGFIVHAPNNVDGDECEFDSRHRNCVNFLWGDARVASISSSIDARLYRQLAVRRHRR